MTLSATPRKKQAKTHIEALQNNDKAITDTIHSLDKLTELWKKHALELEELQARQTEEFRMAIISPISECEMCDMPFERSDEDIQNHEWRCQNCRNYKCHLCGTELDKFQDTCDGCLEDLKFYSI